MKAQPFFVMLIALAFVLAACAPEAVDTAETTDPTETTVGGTSGTTEPEQPQPEPEPTIVSSGTVMEVILIDSISTDTSVAGDVFLATLAAPISVGGSTVVERGVRVRGRVVDVREPGRVRGRARIELVLTEIEGASVNVPVSTAPFIQEADPDLQRDTVLGAAGTAAGAVVGGLAGGRTGAIIGGAAGGAGTVLATRGDQIEHPAESLLTFTLNEDIEIPAGQTIS